MMGGRLGGCGGVVVVVGGGLVEVVDVVGTPAGETLCEVEVPAVADGLGVTDELGVSDGPGDSSTRGVPEGLGTISPGPQPSSA
jgi:hypothetical protein